MSFNDVSGVTVGRNIYRIHFWSMTKSDALNRVKNNNLSEKMDNYNSKNIIFYSDIT